jgi:cytochrome c-type biogenesis protein CcmH
LKPFVAVLAILALVFGLAFAFRSNGSGHPTQAAMEADLICLTCHAPLDESSSPLAQQMKVQIRRLIAQGWSKKQIEDYFVVTEGFGPAVLAVPQSSGFDLFAWLLPFAAIVCGAAAVGIGARTWLANKESDEPDTADGGPPLSPNLEHRVDQELARFDA